jgi:hypothetical protein
MYKDLLFQAKLCKNIMVIRNLTTTFNPQD